MNDVTPTDPAAELEETSPATDPARPEPTAGRVDETRETDARADQADDGDAMTDR